MTPPDAISPGAVVTPLKTRVCRSATRGTKSAPVSWINPPTCTGLGVTLVKVGGGMKRNSRGSRMPRVVAITGTLASFTQMNARKLGKTSAKFVGTRMEMELAFAANTVTGRSAEGVVGFVVLAKEQKLTTKLFRLAGKAAPLMVTTSPPRPTAGVKFAMRGAQGSPTI